jgi:hypothetical protein
MENAPRRKEDVIHVHALDYTFYYKNECSLWQAPRHYNVLTFKPGQTARPQLTACFTSAMILSSSAAVSSTSAKEVGHMAPSSRLATSLKPRVA